VPPSGALVSSRFLLSNEAWTIVGNKIANSAASFEKFSREGLSNYIVATDDKINVAGAGMPDTSLWYFSAPSKFSGSFGIAYGGALQFTLVAFSGDFTNLNGLDTSLVELECSECAGPMRKGIKLVFPIRASLPGRTFKGATTQFSLSLLEGAGWLKDPQNALLNWSPPSQCDMIQVLARLSAVRILGDWTTWYESIALDNVRITNLKGQLPVCAISRPDASLCSCA
jgi:hypothetical protein